MKRKQSVLLASLILIPTLIGIVIGANIVQVTLHSSGKIKAVNVEVFLDQNCTDIASSIDWGMLEKGEQKTTVLYVKNTGNTPLTLSLTTQNWTPTNATTYIKVSWNLENATITADQVLQVDITMSVLPSVSGFTDFSFDIVITGSE